MTRTRLLIVIVVTLSLSSARAWRVTAQIENRVVDVASAAERCAGLMKVQGLPNAKTVVISATLNPAGNAGPSPNPNAPPLPALPGHCELLGRINDRVGVNDQRYGINFRLRLPTSWNGRLFFEGGGGTNGFLPSAFGNLQGQQPTVALALGFAVVSNDSGHDNRTNNDPLRGGIATFGLDPQARIDIAYHAYDEVTRAAKAVLASYYGRPPDKSYYVGCSEGGREGLLMTQRYPSHFDGVLSCAPGLHIPTAAVAGAWESQVFAKIATAEHLLDSNGQPYLNKTFTDEDLVLVSEAVLAACDGLDGATDGMVSNFTVCTTALVAPRLAAVTCPGTKIERCLSRLQVDAIMRVFGGARTASNNPVYVAWPWDAGIGGKLATGFQQGWRSWKLGPYAAPVNTASSVGVMSLSLALGFLAPPVVISSTGGAPAAFAFGLDVDDAVRKLSDRTDAFRESALEFMKADATDLSAFRSRGGKLLIVHGVSDPAFSILDTLDWWNQLDRIEGGHASQFARVFAVPGMNHCLGGPTTEQFNAFEALVDWTERGTVPDRIVATGSKSSPWPGRTRPLCAYPKYAAYDGRGNVDDAASFVCR